MRRREAGRNYCNVEISLSCSLDSLCKVGINTDNIALGSDIEKLSDTALLRLIKKTNIFAKLSPIQKARIVRVLKQSGNNNYAQELGIHPFVAKKLAAAADKYSESSLKNIIYAFDDYDFKTKNGDIDFEIGLKKIICML